MTRPRSTSIGRAAETICGTVRLYPLGADGRWKGDRLAVLASYRHLGLGAPLVRFAVSAAARLGGREMEAFIQPANIAFFRWLGWDGPATWWITPASRTSACSST